MMIHRRIVGLTVGVRRLLALSIALGLAISATWVAQGVLVALIVRRIFDGADWTAIAGFVAAVAGLTLLRAALIFVREVMAKRVAAAVKTRLRSRLFAQLLLLGPGYLESRKFVIPFWDTVSMRGFLELLYQWNLVAKNHPYG